MLTSLILLKSSLSGFYIGIWAEIIDILVNKDEQ